MSFLSTIDILDRLKRVQKYSIRRTIADRSNPMESLSELEFCVRYRFKKNTVLFILNMISKDLESGGPKRGVQIPQVLQLLVSLRFYATGSFQSVIGDISTLSQATVCSIVSKISHCLAKYTNQIIKFPTHEEAVNIRAAFYEVGGFPGVIGAIDCTHIQINSPGGPNADVFRNRKGKFSINVQACCDSNLKFTNIVARWYGSCHDSRIFENSTIKFQLENNIVPGILVGDGGYALLPYLMTPFEPPTPGPQVRFNAAQIKTRNTIERMFGIWKRRFYCLTMLRLKVKNVLPVIMATAVLHNIARNQADYFMEDEIDSDNFPNVSCVSQNSTLGSAVRNSILNSHFN